jgi:hypothetical protein
MPYRGLPKRPGADSQTEVLGPIAATSLQAESGELSAPLGVVAVAGRRPTARFGEGVRERLLMRWLSGD